MTCIFNVNTNRKILEANRNTYINPILHPTRTMKNHDFFYVSEGRWSVSIGNEIINAKKDSVVILPAEVMHYGISKCDAGTRTLFFHASSVNGDGYTDSSTPEKSENRTYIETHIDASNNPNIKKYFENILLSHAEKEDICASAWFLLLLCELYKTSHKKDNGSILAYNMKSIIDNDIAVNISNKALAADIGISTKTAEIIFKRTFGTTIHRYIISERLKKAKFYLENFTDMSIASISESLGFYDEFHLSRQFKEEYGVSPSQVKNNSLKKEFISCK